MNDEPTKDVNEKEVGEGREEKENTREKRGSERERQRKRGSVREREVERARAREYVRERAERKTRKRRVRHVLLVGGKRTEKVKNLYFHTADLHD